MLPRCSLLKATNKSKFKISKSRSFVTAANQTYVDKVFLTHYGVRNIMIEVKT
jgi:hypothetical protein